MPVGIAAQRFVFPTAEAMGHPPIELDARPVLRQPAGGEDSVDGEVFVEFLPAEGPASGFDAYLLELVLVGVAQAAVFVCGEGNLSAVVEFDSDFAMLGPGADRTDGGSRSCRIR